MTNKCTSTKVGAVVALLAATITAPTTTHAATLDPQMLIGSWAVTVDKEDGSHTTEIRIESIDERGRAIGTYCSLWPDRAFFGFHLRPKGGVKTKIDDDQLKFGRSKRKYAFSLNDDGTLQFDFKSKKTELTQVLTRTEGGGCLAWFAPSTETVTHTVAEDDTGELVGVWAGKTKKKAKVELHLAGIDENGQATGLYCWTRKDKSMVAFHIGEGGATQTSLADGTLTAPLAREMRYELESRGTDKLRVTYYKEDKKKRETRLKRAEAKGCLTQIRMLETTS